MSTNLVSVPNIPTQLGENDVFAWQLRLPAEVDQERLVVDMTRVQFGGRVAGLSGIVFGEYPGGHDPNADSVSSYLEQPETALAHGHVWPMAKIDANRGLLNTDVRDRILDGEIPEQAWATALSRVYRSGLRSAAKENLYDSEQKGELYGYATWGGLAIMAESRFLALMTIGTFLRPTAADLMHNREQTGSYHLKEKRWSISPYPYGQVDRLAIASVYAALPVIRCRK